MSAVSYEHRIVVELKDDQGRWHVAMWGTEQPGGRAASMVRQGSVDAKREWGRVRDTGAHPRLLVDLSGWAGWRLHPVVTYERWLNDDGSRSGWAVSGDLEGTWLVDGGCLVPTPREEAA